MTLPIETLVFVAYLDSLFSEATSRREVTPLRTLPETLNQLHAGAMRNHARQSALLTREGANWAPTPDWRLDRQIIRLGLYLRERLDLGPGQRVAVLSELRPEWLIADFAAMGLGATSVAFDPRLQRDELASAFEDATPSITFVSSASRQALESLEGRVPPHGQVILLDSAGSGDDVLWFQTLLEMGGTLDTPERAQMFRAIARDVAPDRPALRHYLQMPDGGWDRVELTQGEVIERLQAGWLSDPARRGDLAYVSDPTQSLSTRLALYAFLGDGYTTTALAARDGEAGDLTALRPSRIIAPAALLAEAVRAEVAGADQNRRSGGWLRRDRRANRNTLGGRARWIGSIDPLDAALAERLGSIAVVWPLPNLNPGGPV